MNENIMNIKGEKTYNIQDIMDKEIKKDTNIFANTMDKSIETEINKIAINVETNEASMNTQIRRTSTNTETSKTSAPFANIEAAIPLFSSNANTDKNTEVKTSVDSQVSTNRITKLIISSMNTKFQPCGIPFQDILERNDYNFSYNDKLINKPKDSRGLDYTSFQNVTGSAGTLIDLIDKGYAVAPCTFKGKRNKKNVNKSYLWFGDIDNGMTLEEAKNNEFISSYCLIYTSPSHSEEHNKFRLISFFSRPVGNDIYEQIGHLINAKIGGVLDPAAMEAGRLFYGNNKADWVWNDVVELPESLLEEAAIQAERNMFKRAELQEKKAANYRRFQNESNPDKDKEAALKALEAIPAKQKGDNRYEEMRRVAVAIMNVFGRDVGISIMEGHSPMPPYYWNNKLRTCTGNFGVGTIVHVAKEYGYVPAKKERPQSFPMPSRGFKPKIKNGKKNSTYIKTMEKERIVVPPIPKPTKEDIEARKRRDEAKRAASRVVLSEKDRSALSDKYSEMTHYTPIYEFEKKYVSQGMKEWELGGKITAIKSPMNTGKTHYLKSLKGKKQILAMGARRLLISATAGHLGCMEVDQHISTDVARLGVDNHQNVSIVIDSLLKLDEADFKGYTIIIDEAEQVLHSLLEGATHIRKVRSRVIPILTRALQECKSIILLDANLTDMTCDFFASLTDKPLNKIRNKYSEGKVSKRVAYVYKSYGKAVGALAEELEKGKKIFLAMDGENRAQALLRLFPDVKSILISRPSITNNPEVESYIKENGRKIKEDGFQLVVASPVIQSGISLELDGYFDCNFGIFCGVLSSSDQRQMLMRDRGNGPRHVCVDTFPRNNLGFDWEEIEQQMVNDDLDLVRSMGLIKVKNGEDYNDLIEAAKTELLKNNVLYGIKNKFTAKLRARANVDFASLRENVIRGLQESGFDCSDAEYTGKNWKEAMDKSISGIKLEKSQDIATAPELTEKKAKELGKKVSKTQAETDQLNKFRIQESLPGVDVTAEFVASYIAKDKQQTISGIRNLVYVMHPEIAVALEVSSLKYTVANIKAKGVFQSDSKHQIALRRVFNGLKIEERLGERIDKKEIDGIIRGLSNSFRRLLGKFKIKWTKKSYPTRILKSILKLYGLTLETIKKGKNPIYRVDGKELIPGQKNWKSIFNATESSVMKRYKSKINQRAGDSLESIEFDVAPTQIGSKIREHFKLDEEDVKEVKQEEQMPVQPEIVEVKDIQEEEKEHNPYAIQWHTEIAPQISRHYNPGNFPPAVMKIFERYAKAPATADLY